MIYAFLLSLILTFSPIKNNLPNEYPVKYTITHESGYVMETGIMFDGKRDGVCKQFYDNGNLKLVSEFNLGKKHGEWRHYNCKGELILTVIYKNDIIISYEKNK